MLNTLIIYYDEISLKGDNKEKFEKLLYKNIKNNLKKANFNLDKAIALKWNHIEINIENLNKENILQIIDVLKLIPGISYIDKVYKYPFTENQLNKKNIWDFVEFYLNNFPDWQSFRVSCKRNRKNFPISSMEVNREVGSWILEKYPQLKVKLKNADFDLHIYIQDKEIYLRIERITGIGGMPVGTAGKIISLLSGGIDSPVASALMMKRGAEIVLCHFQNKTINTNAVEDKIEQLQKQLKKLDYKIKLYIFPFHYLQEEIIKKIPSDYRMIVYKRLMLKIAEKLAIKEKAKALTTGDSLSQVASQTLDNIYTIYKAVNLPILSPLMGFNKTEVIELARKFGTYDISILPYGDCCSLLLSKHPQTHAKLETVEELEKNLNIDDLIEKTFNEVKIYN